MNRLADTEYKLDGSPHEAHVVSFKTSVQQMDQSSDHEYPQQQSGHLMTGEEDQTDSGMVTASYNSQGVSSSSLESRKASGAVSVQGLSAQHKPNTQVNTSHERSVA